MRKELLKGLSEEQIKKVEACKSSEEVLNLAKAEGMELTDEQLEAVSGGGGCFGGTMKCPKCGSKDISATVEETETPLKNCNNSITKFKCRKCGNKWVDVN